MLIQFHLHQHADQFFGFVHIDAMFPGTLDDGLRNEATAAGDHLGRGIAVAVSQGDCHLAFMIWCAHSG